MPPRDPMAAVERRRSVPETLESLPRHLALWRYFRDNPNADLKTAAKVTKMSERSAYNVDRWLVQHGFMIEVRFGDGTNVISARKVLNPASNRPERRRVLGYGDPIVTPTPSKPTDADTASGAAEDT